MHDVGWHHCVRPTLSALSKTLIKLLYCLVMVSGKGEGGGQNYFLKILDMHIYHTSSICTISHHFRKFVNL